jgi:hypothetical protein
LEIEGVGCKVEEEIERLSNARDKFKVELHNAEKRAV